MTYCQGCADREGEIAVLREKVAELEKTLIQKRGKKTADVIGEKNRQITLLQAVARAVGKGDHEQMREAYEAAREGGAMTDG